MDKDTAVPRSKLEDYCFDYGSHSKGKDKTTGSENTLYWTIKYKFSQQFIASKIFLDLHRLQLSFLLHSHVEYPGVPVHAGHFQAGSGLVGCPAGVVSYLAVIGNRPCSSGRVLRRTLSGS